MAMAYESAALQLRLLRPYLFLSGCLSLCLCVSAIVIVDAWLYTLTTSQFCVFLFALFFRLAWLPLLLCLAHFIIICLVLFARFLNAIFRSCLCGFCPSDRNLQFCCCCFHFGDFALDPFTLAWTRPFEAPSFSSRLPMYRVQLHSASLHNQKTEETHCMCMFMCADI